MLGRDPRLLQPPSASSSRSRRASSRRSWPAACARATHSVSTGSPRRGLAPAATSASHTNSHPCTPPPRHRPRDRQSAPPTQHRGRRGVDPAPPDLTRFGLQRVERELPPVHIEPGYDRHQGLLRVPAKLPPARNDLAPSRRRPGSCHLCAECETPVEYEYDGVERQDVLCPRCARNAINRGAEERLRASREAAAEIE